MTALEHRLNRLPRLPHLSWLRGKMHKNSNPKKNISGHAPEHSEALIENASRTFAIEVDKALKADVIENDVTLP